MSTSSPAVEYVTEVVISRVRRGSVVGTSARVGRSRSGVGPSRSTSAEYAVDHQPTSGTATSRTRDVGIIRTDSELRCHRRRRPVDDPIVSRSPARRRCHPCPCQCSRESVSVSASVYHRERVSVSVCVLRASAIGEKSAAQGSNGVDRSQRQASAAAKVHSNWTRTGVCVRR